MLMNKFRKKNASSTSLKSQPTTKDQDSLDHASFQTFPLISRRDYPTQFSSLGYKRASKQQQEHQQHSYHPTEGLSHISKSNNSSTVSFSSTDIPALSHSAVTSSSSSSIPSDNSLLFSTPTLHNKITVTTPPQERHLNHPTPTITHPSRSLSNISTPRPAPNTTNTTTTTTATATHHTALLTKLAAENGHDHTIVAPGGVGSGSDTYPHFDQTQQNRTHAQSVPPARRHPSNLTQGGYAPFSLDATQQNHQLQPPNNQLATRPRAFSQNTPISPNTASFPTHKPKKTASLCSADPHELHLPSPQPPLPQHSVDTTSTRSFKKIGRRQIRRSKTDYPKQPGGIATALALSGVSLTPHCTSVSLAENMQSTSSSNIGSFRSPEETDNRSVHTNDSRHWTQNTFSNNDDQLGTGYAVASSKRNADFHAIFKSIPDDDYLVEDYGCALQRDILVQGRIYISEQHLCFKANIFGWVTTLVVPFSDIAAIEKRMTALIIPNAIQVITTQSRHTFASFLTRDTAYDMMTTLWHNAHPPGASPPLALNHDGANSSTCASGDGVRVEYQDPSSTLSRSSAPMNKREHPITQCACSPETHCKEVIWDATYPISPEKLYNLLFQSDFLKDFWVNEEHLTEIEVGDWTTAPDAKFPSRTLSYVRPLNAPVGPKTIKCLLSDEHLALDFDQYVSIMSTTVTPDAPAGGGFCVKTLNCITWQANNSSRWLVTAGVEWTKVNRFLKGIIESSTISGQKAHQVAVDRALRNHIQLHHAEPNLDRAELSATFADINSDEALRCANETKNAQASGRNETKIKRAHTLANNPFWTIKHQFEVLSSGTQSSWMMMASVALAVILLVANLLTVNRGDPVSISGIRRATIQGERSDQGGQGFKPQLTEDVAETVREALQQYFSDHSSSPPPPRVNVKQAFSEEISSGVTTQDQPPENQKPINSFAKEELEEIELLLESLEQRIRNLRKSLVDDRLRH